MNMIRNISIAGALGLAMLLSAGTPAYAASLSSTQVSAIVSLLQSFGVDQQTTLNVEAALGVTQPIASKTFVATPQSGSAPLTVSFNASGLSSETYLINYGDGQNSGPINTIEPPCSIANTNQCGPMIANTHTYASAGTYSATLIPYIGCMYSEPRCMIMPQLIGSAVITVTGQSTGGLSISGLDAPSQLAVGQMGTWTVHVNNASGQLSYSVIWGDEGAGATTSAAPVSSTVSTSGTFTHSYMSSAVYTPRFTVSGANGSAQTSATVIVGSPTPVPVPPPCFRFSGDLRVGSSGTGIVELQQALGVSATGYFGPLTAAAVKQWQAGHSVPATGYVGALTRAAFIRWCPIPPPNPGPSQVTLSSVSPASGSVGTNVTLAGFGFTNDNTILFDGSIAVRNASVISSVAIACTTDPDCRSGIRQTLQFTVPSTLGPNCPVGSLCPTYVRSVTPGQYAVSVENSNGTSHTSVFTVTSN